MSDRDASPFKICSGKKPNLRHLRVFGCRVYALPAKAQDAKSITDARVGIFLGLTSTMKNIILYYDIRDLYCHQDRQACSTRHV